jgi:hypothetical protein
LHNARSFGRWGPNPILYSEIAAYESLRDVIITPFEIDLITRLDGLYRSDALHPVEFEPEGGVKAMMRMAQERRKKDE